MRLPLFLLVVASPLICGKLQLEDVINCEKTSPLVLNMVKRGFTNDGYQLLDIIVNTTIDIANDNLASLTLSIPAPLNKNKWYAAYTDSNNPMGFCALLNKYMGEMLMQIETDVGLTPKKCPIKKGFYKITNYRMPFEKLGLPVVPPGRIRVLAKAVSKRTKKSIICLDFYLLNK